MERKGVVRSALPTIARRAVMVLGTIVLASAIALFRFRLSPWYPHLNDLQSDFFTYHLIGNSWAEGRWPYRDVFDVKGPALFLMTRGFAEVAPWATWPALVTLAALAAAALVLAYAIARRHLSAAPAALSAAASVVLIEMSMRSNISSFTCEELAVPGVLLVVWLALRLVDGESVSCWWWLANGLACGVLFWCKYQVVSPWAGLLLGLILVRRHIGLSWLRIRHLLTWNLIGFVIATVVVLAWYLPVLGDMFFAYFGAKDVTANLAAEPGETGQFLVKMWSTEPVAIALLVLSALTLLARPVRTRAETVVLGVGLALAFLGSITLVRHEYNLYVPLAFVAAALPILLRVSAGWLSPSRESLSAWPAVITASIAVLAAGFVANRSVAFSEEEHHLFQTYPRPSARCLDLPTQERAKAAPSTTAAFVRRSGGESLLSVGSAFSVRSSSVTHRVDDHRFAYLDSSYSAATGARQVQEEYLKRGDYRFVWILAPKIDFSRPFGPQLLAQTDPKGPVTPTQARTLLDDYRPVLSCGSNVLMERNS